jgi:predicted nucleic acid-binding protein
VETYVFDTEPIIAWLHDEPGHEYVGTLLEAVDSGTATGVIADANAAEIVYLDARLLAAARDETAPTIRDIAEGLYDVTMLERAGLRIADAGWQHAGRIKAPGGLSLGDAFAVAQALEDDATLVVGADDDFADLPVDVAIERFRTEPA